MADQYTPQPTNASALDPRRWWTLGATCFGLFMALLDVTVVNVALPTIGDGLHASLSDLEWVINAYSLVFAVLLVSAGRIGDLFGRKRFFLLGLAVFTLGSLGSALANSLAFDGVAPIRMLIFARGLQGIGSAFMMPLALAIISATFHGKERGLAIGIYGGVSALGLGLGPVIGGLLVDRFNWESIFYLNVPIGVIGIAAGAWIIAESRDTTAPRTIDIAGLLTLSATLFCLIFALMEGNDRGWNSAYILGLFAAAVVIGVVFVVVERTVRNPMVDLGLFRNASFSGSAIVAFCLHGGQFALLFFLTLYLQNLLGFSPLGGGLRLLPISLMTLIVSPLSGALSERIGVKPIMAVGMALAAVSTLLLTVMSANDTASDWTKLLPALLLGGIAGGLVSPLISTVAVNTVDRDKVGMASGISGLCRQLGIAFGTALLGAVLTHQYNATLHDRIPQLPLAGMPPQQAETVRDNVLNGLIKAGTFVGSTGLRHPPAQFAAIAKLPAFPQLQAIARDAFIAGMTDLFYVGAAVLVIGCAGALMVKQSDMRHRAPERAVQHGDVEQAAQVAAERS